MGRTYCVTGAVCRPRPAAHTIRALFQTQRDVPVRNVGWSPFLLDGHSRWEMYEVWPQNGAAAGTASGGCVGHGLAFVP